MWLEITNKDLIVINPDVENKNELFEKMVNHVYNHDLIINKKAFMHDLKSREAMVNTELIPGVALPHAQSKMVDRLFLSIVILKKGIDYENPEMGPVRIIFFFGSPENQNKEYLKYLARSSRLLKNKAFHESILKVKEASEAIKVLEEFSKEEAETNESGNYLMILTLNNPDKESDVLSSMVELGITGASIIETTSMAKKLAYEMPIFAGLSYMAHGKSNKSMMIMASVSERRIVDKLALLLKDNGIDLNVPGIGYIQLIPVFCKIGTTEEQIEL